MFVTITVLLFILSFILALRSAAKLGEKPSIKNVKKSIDKDKIIFHSSSGR